MTDLEKKDSAREFAKQRKERWKARQTSLNRKARQLYLTEDEFSLVKRQVESIRRDAGFGDDALW